jgi:hypothetical protein
MESPGFDALLRQYRVAAGLSQETLAEPAGHSLQAVRVMRAALGGGGVRAAQAADAALPPDQAVTHLPEPRLPTPSTGWTPAATACS